MCDPGRFSDLPLWFFWSEHEHLLSWYLLQEKILQHPQRCGAVQRRKVDISYIASKNFSNKSFYFSLKSELYEKSLKYELSQANVLKNSEHSPCDEKFWPKPSENTANILFISMSHSKDFTSWLALAKCLRVWDLDARGYHKGLWRLHYNQTPLFVVGVPFSPYS